MRFHVLLIITNIIFCVVNFLIAIDKNATTPRFSLFASCLSGAAVVYLIATLP